VSATGGLGAFFSPRSVAVLGASRDPGKWGRRVLDYTRELGFEGSLYGVNPAAASFPPAEGVRFVPDVKAIGEPLDLAVVALPAVKTPDAVRSCVRAGAKAVVLAASGFGERGAGGRALEEEIQAAVAGTPMRLLGPNGFGLFAAPGKLNLTPKRDLPAGHLALLTQSGNVAIALAGEATRAGIGFSACVGVGNQLDVGFGELLGYFAADDATSVIACYVEGVRRGQGCTFREGLRACRQAGKPVVVLKAGSSAQGAAAAATHTGSLAADNRVWGAVLDDAGALRVTSTEHLIDVAAAQLHLTPSRGRVMVLTNGGGDSVMATDAVAGAGLTMAQPAPRTVAALEALTPPDAPRVPSGNPATLDTAGGVDEDPELLARCVDAVAGDPGVDIVAVAGVFGGYHHLRDKELACVESLLATARRGVRLVFQSAYADAGEEPLERLRAGGVPVYPTVQRLAAAVATTAARGAPPAPAASPASGPGTGTRLLGLAETARLVASYGITLPELRHIKDPADLADAVTAVGYPACLKLADPAVGHKSDVGGVRLSLRDPGQVTAAARELWRRFPDAPLLLMPMLAPGFELLAGTISDPEFGPLVMVGRGGIWAEAEADIAVRMAPVTPGQAISALRSLRCAPMLGGGRGQPPLDVDAAGTVVAGLSRLAAGHPELSVEINPLIVYPHGCAVADLRAAYLPGQDPAGPP
jgi:acyl-CoA synthetase (NDP forming)